MEKKFTDPQLEVIELQVEDVITTSTGNSGTTPPEDVTPDW